MQVRIESTGNMKLRIGVVGLGDDWEQRHRPALRALADRFEVKAICAEVSLLAQQAARDFNATAVGGYRVLAAREDIDAVFMLSPGWYGALPILSACELGKSVYCAATFDIQPADADEVRRRVDKAGVAFMAEFPRRLAPATLRLKELIATRLGEPRLLFCHSRLDKKQKQAVDECYRQPSSTREMMALIDWCNYVIGRRPASLLGIEHISAECPTENDYQMLSLDYSQPGATGNGPIAQISCGSYMVPSWHEARAFRPPADLQVCCEKGMAFVDLPTGLTWFDEAGRHRESLDSERPVGEQLLTQFYRAVTSLVRKTTDLDDVYRALSIVQLSKTSFLEGRRIDL